MKQNFGQPVEAKTAGMLQSSRKEDQSLSSATNGFQNSMTWCTNYYPAEVATLRSSENWKVLPCFLVIFQ